MPGDETDEEARAKIAEIFARAPRDVPPPRSSRGAIFMDGDRTLMWVNRDLSRQEFAQVADFMREALPWGRVTTVEPDAEILGPGYQIVLRTDRRVLLRDLDQFLDRAEKELGVGLERFEAHPGVAR